MSKTGRYHTVIGLQQKLKSAIVTIVVIVGIIRVASVAGFGFDRFVGVVRRTPGAVETAGNDDDGRYSRLVNVQLIRPPARPVRVHRHVDVQSYCHRFRLQNSTHTQYNTQSSRNY